MAEIAVYDNVDALHRNAATRRRISLDHQQSAIAGCARVLARIAVNHHGSRHHVFSHTWAGRTYNVDVCLLVHAGAVVPGGSTHGDFYRTVQTAGNRMAAPRVDDLPDLLVGVRLLRLQGAVHFA